MSYLIQYLELSGLTFSPGLAENNNFSASCVKEPLSEPHDEPLEVKQQYVALTVPEGASDLVNLDCLVEASPEDLAARSSGPTLIEQQRIQNQRRMQAQIESSCL